MTKIEAQEEKYDRGSPHNALIFDIGSTWIKMGVYDPKKIAEKFSGSPSQPSDTRISYSSKVVRAGFPEFDPPVPEFRWTDAKDFTLPILDSVYQLLSAEHSPVVSSVVLTGWTNSLVVSYKGKDRKDQFGAPTSRTVILMEDPELQTELNNKQKEILSGFLGESFAQRGLKVSSSLMKLLALMNNPGVVQYLFGPGVKFEDLEFTSMLGFLRHILSGNERGLGRINRSLVPVADLKGFASVPGKNASEVSRLMAQFGIRPSQVIFSDSASEESQGIKTVTYNDFEANIEMISKLISPGVNKLPSDLVGIEIGTVAKVFAKGDPQGKAYKETGKRLGEMVYASQRNGGRVKTNIIDHLIGNMPPETGNAIIDLYLSDGLTESFDKNPYIYLPDNGENGRLFKGDTEISLEQEELKKLNLPYDEIGKIVRAVIRGVGFGCREKAEKILKAKEQDPNKTDYYCYGGAPDSIPFRETLAQCFPGIVRHLHLPDSGKSATFLYYRQKGLIGAHDEKNLVIVTHDVEKQIDREKEYKRWKQLKERIS